MSIKIIFQFIINSSIVTITLYILFKDYRVAMQYQSPRNNMIFVVKQSKEFSLIYLGTVKQDCEKKTREIYIFLFLITGSVKHISSHIIKQNQYFSIFIWIVFINIFINMIYIVRVFILRSQIKSFNTTISCLIISN